MQWRSRRPVVHAVDFHMHPEHGKRLCPGFVVLCAALGLRISPRCRGSRATICRHSASREEMAHLGATLSCAGMAPSFSPTLDPRALAPRERMGSCRGRDGAPRAFLQQVFSLAGDERCFHHLGVLPSSQLACISARSRAKVAASEGSIVVINHYRYFFTLSAHSFAPLIPS